MKRVFLFLAVVILLCNTILAQEPDPDPNLLWVSDPSWENGFHRFLVHPNGNILAGIGSTEFELDGNTGLIIREFPHPIAVFYDVSPDGKYISALADSNRRCVIDYETEEIITRFTISNTTPKFMPDNKTLIYTEEVQGSGTFKLASFNIETKQHRESQNYFSKTQIGSPCVSPDGKFVATGGWYYKTKEEGDTHLLLWDAQTLEPIRVLGEFENFNEVRSIKFSPDSRLVGFNVYDGNLFIYKTDDYSLLRHYGLHIDVEHDVNGFCFLPNNLLAFGNVTAGGSTDPIYTKIEDLNTSKLLYNDRTLWSNAMEYNPHSNTWLVKRIGIYCYDFEKILSGASTKSEIPNPFTVEYITNTLFIKNHNFTSLQLSVQITDINGRIIRNIDLHTSTGDIRIPIKLLSGTYFLHIKDGNKEYVSKFLVTN
jgi:WD40 repeat protein